MSIESEIERIVKGKNDIKGFITGRGVSVPADTPISGYRSLLDKVPGPKPEQAYNKTYTANGDYPITPDPGKVITGGTIKVDVPSKVPVIKPKTITENGTFNAADEGADGYNPLTVNVSSDGGVDLCTVSFTGKPIIVDSYTNENMEVITPGSAVSNLVCPIGSLFNLRSKGGAPVVCDFTGIVIVNGAPNNKPTYVLSDHTGTVYVAYATGKTANVNRVF